MNRSEVLKTADDLINGDRQNDYGEAADSFKAIGQLWSAYLGVDVAPHDVAMMMVMLRRSDFQTHQTIQITQWTFAATLLWRARSRRIVDFLTSDR